MASRSITFRKATPDDIDYLLSLRESTMKTHFENTGTAYEADFQYQRVLYGLDYALILVIDGQDSGLLKLNRQVSPWELVQIQIAPRHQNQGLGDLILKQVITDAKTAGEDILLNVLKGSPARRLYERNGFSLLSEKGISLCMKWRA